jgi:hypothetical protein
MSNKISNVLGVALSPHVRKQLNIRSKKNSELKKTNNDIIKIIKIIFILIYLPHSKIIYN